MKLKKLSYLKITSPLGEQIALLKGKAQAQMYKMMQNLNEIVISYLYNTMPIELFILAVLLSQVKQPHSLICIVFMKIAKMMKFRTG